MKSFFNECGHKILKIYSVLYVIAFKTVFHKKKTSYSKEKLLQRLNGGSFKNRVYQQCSMYVETYVKQVQTQTILVLNT